MPNSDYLYEINDFGIEIEFSNVDRSGANFSKEFNEMFPNYRREHDASCETPSIYSINNIPMTISNKKDEKILGKICRREIVIGGEIVSPILSERNTWVNDIYKLCELLWRYGESSQLSLRDSLHVHVNVGKTVTLSKILRLLTLHNQLEAILYRLGGMSKVNRGQENSYIYQRPYLGNSAPVVKRNRYYYPIFDLDDLYESTSKEQFFDRLGDSNTWYSRNRKYVTQRYMGMNFYSIPFFGTVEFRHSNKTLIPEYIVAWVNFCIAFNNLTDNKLDQDTFRPLYENREISDSEFQDVLSRFTLDDTYKSILLEIWQRSSTPNYDNLWRLSHLSARGQETFFENSYTPNHLPNDVHVEKPSHVDIHVLRERFVEPRNNENEGDELERNRNFSDFWYDILRENNLMPIGYARISRFNHTDHYVSLCTQLINTGVMNLSNFGLLNLNIESLDFNEEYSVYLYCFSENVGRIAFMSNMEDNHYYSMNIQIPRDKIINVANIFEHCVNRPEYYGEI